MRKRETVLRKAIEANDSDTVRTIMTAPRYLTGFDECPEGAWAELEKEAREAALPGVAAALRTSRELRARVGRAKDAATKLLA